MGDIGLKAAKITLGASVQSQIVSCESDNCYNTCYKLSHIVWMVISDASLSC